MCSTTHKHSGFRDNGRLDSTAAPFAHPDAAFNQPMKPRHQPLQAIAMVVLAVACFGGLDTATKVLTATVPLVMALWFRYIFQAGFTALVLLPRRGLQLFQTQRPGLQLLRGMLMLTTTAVAYVSLTYTPVGEFTAIIMLAPLMITLVAARTLGEHVSALRWLLVLGGFGGAMLVIRPGAEVFDWTMLLPLILAISIAGYQILTGYLSRIDDPGTIHFYTGLSATLVTSLALPFFWTELSAQDWWLMVLVALLSSLGHVLFILAYQRAEVTSLMPFFYLQIAFATLGGWLVFNHVPDGLSWTGILLIGLCGAGGTWLAARERSQQTPKATPRTMP